MLLKSSINSKIFLQRYSYQLSSRSIQSAQGHLQSGRADGGLMLLPVSARIYIHISPYIMQTNQKAVKFPPI
jgi:hypothetical protein